MSAETRIIGFPDRDNFASDHPIYGQTPTQIDEYKVIKLIGQGSMGSVYEVQHSELGRHFALKLMAGNLAGNQEAIDRFRAETKALGKLDHPNIVRAIDAGQWQGRLFLVTELLVGSDLASHVVRFGRMEIDNVIPLAIQLCDALGSAHSQGFFHRDIKPSNIFLLQNGSVKLLDFGLVRCESTASMTRAGSFMGTVDFVAPEQAGNPTIARANSDIYSLGCTLIYLLSGQPPFEDQSYPSMAAKIHAHLHDMPKWFDSNHSEQQRWFVDLLRSMVAKNPDARPSNCQEIANRLRLACQPDSPLNTKQYVDGHISAVSPLRKSASTRRNNGFALIGIASSLALAGLWWHQSNPDNPPSPQIKPQSSDAIQSVESLAENSRSKAELAESDQATTPLSPAMKNSTDQTATLPVSRTQSAKGVPQFSKQIGGKGTLEKPSPSVLTNKYD